jgi:hypothetical protein
MTTLILHVHRPGWTRPADTTEGPDIIHRHTTYGSAYTGRPIDEVRLEDAPTSRAEDEWLERYLYCYMAPGAHIVPKEDQVTAAPEFKHPPTPPAIPTDAKLEPVPVVTVLHTLSREFDDVPGALRAMEDLMERALLTEMEPRYGREVALRALGHIHWSREPGRWPGDKMRLTAAINVQLRTLGHAYWAPVPPPAGLQSDTEVTDTREVASPALA